MYTVVNIKIRTMLRKCLNVNNFFILNLHITFYQGKISI